MPFIWVAITIPILLVLQRWIHRHLHGVAYLITGKRNWAVILYALILFPGVLLHELSHWLTATILGVRTGSFSVLPKTGADGTIQLGYVEYYKSSRLGPIRESLIGSAPLVTGTIAVLLIAINVFDLPELVSSIQNENIDALVKSLSNLFGTGDFLIWLYLIFAISNAMMPSTSDRRAWPAFALIMVAFAIFLYFLGLMDVFVETLIGPAAIVFGYLGLAYSLAIGVDLFFMFCIWIVEWIISRIKGVDVVYGRAEPGG
ncbi:MAG TPA: hypothetical protein DEP47_13545 [Chloroflexi bacterium]|nr:hypothetical protein [Chloroflexota bacterium]